LCRKPACTIQYEFLCSVSRTKSMQLYPFFYEHPLFIFNCPLYQELETNRNLFLTNLPILYVFRCLILFLTKHLCFAYIPLSVFPQNCFPLVKLIVDLSIYIREGLCAKVWREKAIRFEWRVGRANFQNWEAEKEKKNKKTTIWLQNMPMYFLVNWTIVSSMLIFRFF
jgi:hypothetical protein